MNEQTQTERTTDRQRPRWASAIHHFGDDLRWTCSGWTDFPRPVRRTTAAAIAFVGGRAAGVDEAVSTIVELLVE